MEPVIFFLLPSAPLYSAFSTMKIAIIGPGALGTLLAASLTIRSNPKTPLDLWLLDYKPERAKFLNEQGLILEKGGQRLSCKINATADPNKIGPTDIIILCVKYPDVADGLQQAAKLAHPDSLLVTLQNGIGHLELLKAGQGSPAIVLGVTAMGANLLSPGHVRHAGSGLTRIGFLKSASFARSLLLAQVCNLLNDCGMETAIVDDILDYVWTKLLINVGINALTAIHRCPNGELLESDDILNTLTAVVKEGEAVARAKGIQVVDDPLAMTLDVCRKTARNLSSMLQDINNKKPTEIDSINGEIVAAGRKLGIPVPANEALVQKVKNIEKAY
jgi:2-dehydropantoate 2-reductase